MNFSNVILQRAREIVVTSFDNNYCKFIDELFAKQGDKSIHPLGRACRVTETAARKHRSAQTLPV
jgi:hypothetical protein